MKRIMLFSLLIFVSLTGGEGGSVLWAQAQPVVPDPSLGGSSQFDMTGFPQWARDLRRANVIMFGAYPFVYLLTNVSYDYYRFASNDWDRRHAPRPFRAAAHIEQTQDQKFQVLKIAAAGSVVFAIVDHGIVQYKRYSAAKEIRAMAPGDPIIIRTPMYEDEDELSATGNH